MNAKKCKALRKLLRKDGRFEKETTYTYENQTKGNPNGTRRVHPACERGVYLNMKKGLVK